MEKSHFKTRQSCKNQSDRTHVLYSILCLGIFFFIYCMYVCTRANCKMCDISMRQEFNDSLKSYLTSRLWPHYKCDRQCRSARLINRWCFVNVSPFISLVSHKKNSKKNDLYYVKLHKPISNISNIVREKVSHKMLKCELDLT